MERAIFEFTNEGKRFEVYEHGCVRITPSNLPVDANIVINRIPQALAEMKSQNHSNPIKAFKDGSRRL
jgi:hypothetical protein